MTTFYLVRHAHSPWTEDLTLDSIRSLSNKGKQDAQYVGHILQQYPIQAIYSSPYRRAIETIQPLAEISNIPIQTDYRLAERKVSSCAVDDFLKAIHFLWQHPIESLPGGESNILAQKRGLSLVHKLIERGKHNHIVISTHGNLLTLILQHFYPEIGYNFWTRLAFPDIYCFHVRLPSRFIEDAKINLADSQPECLWNKAN